MTVRLQRGWILSLSFAGDIVRSVQPVLVVGTQAISFDPSGRSGSDEAHT